MSKWAVRTIRTSVLAVAIASVLLLIATAQTTAVSESGEISAPQFDRHVTEFLGREIGAHVADLRSLNPPQDYVVGARTGGEFSWGTFMRAVASYSALSGDTMLSGKDLEELIGQLGLIEAERGGKTFAQLYAAISLRTFGTDLGNNAVWQKLTPEEQAQWRSLLDPARFYDRKTRHVINLPENYFGVAARVVTIDYELGIIKDRAFVDDVLDRAAQQFTQGNLYSDDGLPAGRYDRYSNEYARYVYMASENVGRKDLMEKLTPTLKTQMHTWWDLLSPDGYGYPWGRSLGAISYEDTLEIVAFLAAHPQFRPAPLPELASAYYAAWSWLENDFREKPHLLNVFGPGRGNYSYISPEREWQQTAAFFGKASGAHKVFVDALRKEGVTEFPAKLQLPEVTRFEFFRKGNRPAGVWLVRRPEIRFALPIVAGTRAGVSDYLPAPYNLAGFAAPTEQMAPTVTPYLEIDDKRTVVAGDAADQIAPSADAMSLRATWKRWAVVGGKAGTPQDVGLTSEVTWKIDGNRLVRTERIAASKPIHIRRFWVMVPSTCDHVSTSIAPSGTNANFSGNDARLDVTIENASIPLNVETVATRDSALGKSSRGAIPLYLNVTGKDISVTPDEPIEWTLAMQTTSSPKEPPDRKSELAAANDPQPGTTSTSNAVRYYPSSTVQQSFSSGSALFQEAGLTYSIATSRRDKPGVAEVHLRNNEMIFVQEGSAIFVTGGTVVAPHSIGPDEIRGESIVGGEVHEFSKGDVIVVPAGTPHWFKEVRGTFLSYVVKAR
jgi:mannose-6-phosphate isomerase-like protein (cupin superfamily)